MTDKVVKFSAQLDTSVFDKKIQELTAKANELNRNFSRASSGPNNLSPATQDAYKRSTLQNERELVKILSEQDKLQDKSAKLIVNKRNEIDSLIKKQKSFVGSLDEEVKMMDKIAAKKTNLNALEAKHNQAMRVISGAKQGIDDRERLKLNNLVPPTFKEVLGAIGTASGIITPILMAVKQAIAQPQLIEEMRAGAVSNTTGMDARRMAAGKSPFDAIWMNERGKASGLAEEKATSTRKLDDFVDDVTLGLAGFLSPKIKELEMSKDSFSSPEEREKHRRNYEQFIGADQASDFRKNLENFKQQSVGKTMATDYMENNFQQNLAGQRMMGLSDKEMTGKGGFLQSGAAAGFMGDQMLGMMGGIIGAGGSARGGTKDAMLGLQMQRQGFTNSSNILGSITGGISGAGNTKNAAIEIMSESFKIGLNNSEFSEENRKFTEAAAAIVARTGDTSKEGRQNTLDMLGSMVTDRTNAGIAAAMSTYEGQQQRSGDMSGRRGAMKWSGAMKDPILSKLGYADMSSVLSTREENMPANDPQWKSMADKMNKEYGTSYTSADLFNAKHKLNAGTQFMRPGDQERMDELRKKVSEFTNSPGNIMSGAQFGEKALAGTLPQNMQDIAGEMEGITRFGRGDISTRAALGEGMLGVKGGKVGDFKGADLDKMGERIGDTITSKAAAGADEARGKFDELYESLKKLVGVTDEYIAGVSKSTDQHQATTNSNLRSMASGSPTNKSITDRISPTVQNQGGTNRK